MARKNIFFKRRPKWQFSWILGAFALVAGLSWSFHGVFRTGDLPACDSRPVRQEIGKVLAAEWSSQDSDIEVVSYRENRRRLAGDVIEARDCAARTLLDGNLGIVRYSVLRRSDGDGFRVNVMGQEAQQGERR